MMCNMKTMLKVGLGMLLVAGSAYLLLPQFREAIVALAPTLAILLCPISMLACMWMMRGNGGQACQSQGDKDDGAQAQALAKAKENVV